MAYKPEQHDPLRGRIPETLINPAAEAHGRPSPREATSQQAQLNSVHRHGTRKDVKVPMNKKLH